MCGVSTKTDYIIKVQTLPRADKEKGLGLIAVTGCSHAGVVNTARHVKRSQQQEGKEDEAREDQEEDIFAIIGGYHLATSDEAAVHATVHDLKALNPHFLVPGHCSGWRVKMAIENAMPGRLLPCSVGAKLTFADQALSAGDPSVPCSSSTKY